MSGSLYALLASGAERDDTVFVRPRDGAAARSRGEIFALAGRMASVLREAGAAPGERVVARVDKSIEAIALYLACLRCGAVYVPLNPAHAPAEFAFHLGDAAPRVFVCRPGERSALTGLAAEHAVARVLTLGAAGEGSLAEAAAEAGELPVVSRGGRDPAAMLYTSGTTGRPKGAVLTHEGLAANARALHDVWGWRRDDVLLHALPIFHVHGLFVALHCALLGGSAVELLSRFDVGEVREALPRSTVMMGVPTYYTRLLADDRFGREDCASMRLFVCGSAPLPEAVHEAFEARTGHRILERYGMTEAAIIASNPLDGERVAGTVGFPLEDVELRIVDERGERCATGDVGSVRIRASSLFSGYWGLPDETRAVFDDQGFFETGDLGSIDAEGRLTLVGRASDLVISGGYNVYPKEIERVLDAVEGVRESAVVGLPHADLGEAPVAFVVAERDAELRALRGRLEAELAARLARYKHPRRLFVLDELPRNAMGKVEKAALQRAHENALARDAR